MNSFEKNILLISAFFILSFGVVYAGNNIDLVIEEKANSFICAYEKMLVIRLGANHCFKGYIVDGLKSKYIDDFIDFLSQINLEQNAITFESFIKHLLKFKKQIQYTTDLVIDSRIIEKIYELARAYKRQLASNYVQRDMLVYGSVTALEKLNKEYIDKVSAFISRIYLNKNIIDEYTNKFKQTIQQQISQ